MAWQERQNMDDWTIGNLFYLINDALPDLAFEEALVYLLLALKGVKKQLNEKIEKLKKSQNRLKFWPI